MLLRVPCGAIGYGKIEMKFMSQNVHSMSYQKESVHELFMISSTMYIICYKLHSAIISLFI